MPKRGTLRAQRGLKCESRQILPPRYIFSVLPSSSGSASSGAAVGYVTGISNSRSNSYLRRSWKYQTLPVHRVPVLLLSMVNHSLPARAERGKGRDAPHVSLARDIRTCLLVDSLVFDERLVLLLHTCNPLCGAEAATQRQRSRTVWPGLRREAARAPSPSRGPAVLESSGSFCTVSFVVASTMSPPWLLRWPAQG